MPTIVIGMMPAMKIASMSAIRLRDTVRVMRRQATLLLVLLSTSARAAPIPDDALIDAGSRKLQDGDAKGAIEDFKHAAEKSPKDPRAHYLRGAALQKLDDAQGAEEAFKKALALDP